MEVIKVLKAQDATGKVSIKLDDNSVIESVLLVDQTDRVTACISSQVGCAQGCKFCKTGQLGLKRNLTTSEIVQQFHKLEETFNREITNIVYMGMGEPLHNTKNVLESIKYFTNPKGPNVFLRRITISTSGAINGMPKLLEEKPYPGLAFSLITANQNLRTKLMPGTPDLEKIKTSLLNYQRVAKKRIIIEVINFCGINETVQEAALIWEFLEGLDVIINLIPFNSIGESQFKEPKMEKVVEFSQMLKFKGLKVTIRHGKGQDIAGACGQLGQL